MDAAEMLRRFRETNLAGRGHRTGLVNRKAVATTRLATSPKKRPFNMLLVSDVISCCLAWVSQHRHKRPRFGGVFLYFRVKYH